MGVGSGKIGDANVAILEGENDDSISFTLDGNSIETNSLYFRYVPSSRTGNEIIDAYVKLYFKDIDGDIDNDHEGRIQLVNASDTKFVVGDTEMDITFDVGGLTLTIEGEVISIPFGITDTNEFTHLGSSDEDAEPSDVSVGDEDIGTRDDDVLTHYGAIVRDPGDNADSDRVILSIPDEQVFAKVSVLGQGMAIEEVTEGNETTVLELGGLVILDSEISAHVDKNLILIGGSCINSATAKVLGVTYPTCGADFSLATGVTSGKYLIQSFVSPYNAEKIAIVVGGFHGEDTTRAVSDFIASTEDFSIVGTKIVG